MASYSETDLGAYAKYSFDPDIEGGRVFAARDRAGPGKYVTGAAIWDGAWSDLPDPPPAAEWTVATAGFGRRAVGLAYAGANAPVGQAMLWRQLPAAWAGEVLSNPPLALGAAAYGLAPDASRVLGEAEMSAGQNTAAIWSDAGSGWSVELLPQPGPRGYAVGFDPGTGAVFGNVLNGAVWQAVRWLHDGTGWAIAILPAPGTPPPAAGDIHSGVNRVRDGLAAGWVSVSGGPERAVAWDMAGMVTDLASGDGTEATATNGTDVVGVDRSSGEPRGFVWSPAGGAASLHGPGAGWSYPGGIDAEGRIVMLRGDGSHGGDPTTRLFLLTPAPSPFPARP